MNNQKEILLFLDKVRERIIEFKKSKDTIHSAIRYDICTIEIAACFLELKISRERNVKSEELHWFKGERYIEDTFGNNEEFSDLYRDYLKIQSLLKSSDRSDLSTQR